MLDFFIQSKYDVVTDYISLVAVVSAFSSSGISSALTRPTSTSAASISSTVTPLLTTSTSGSSATSAFVPSTTTGSVSACTNTTGSVLSNGGFDAPMGYITIPSWKFAGPIAENAFSPGHTGLAIIIWPNLATGTAVARSMQQTVAICPGTPYLFQFWLTSIYVTGNACPLNVCLGITTNLL
ncbi:hypothetical protein BDZ45DRAFT_374883 [Acephala macrosclerotiorum]|nr:hypothetical protein BDZ45DRAFT_374883 [Acephala macrosclerotiorum]